MLNWENDQLMHRARNHQRVYQIILHAGNRWQLRVRNTEEPMDVPLDDLWETLGFYRSPDIAKVHAACHEEEVA